MFPSYLLAPVVGGRDCLRFRPFRPYPPHARCGDLDSFPFLPLPLPRHNQIHPAALDDVAGVAVRILPMPASLADKLGLSNPVVRMRAAALATLLRGSIGGNHDRKFVKLSRFISTELSGESPRCFQNRTIEPGFLPHPTAGPIRRAPGRSGQVANLEILEHQKQRLWIVDQLSASLMRKVPPQIGRVAPQRRYA